MTTRVVLDTNILVSGILFKGKPNKILQLVIDGQIISVTSSVLLSELIETLIKDFNFSSVKLQEIENSIREKFIFVQPREKINIARDIDDNRVLEAAGEAKCDYIVTGDKDLLVLNTFKNIKIVTAHELLEKFE